MSVDDLRREIADGCRVLAARGLAPGILGHISVRVDGTRLLVRCRGSRERGLAHTTADDVRLVDLDGAAGAPGELDGYAVPFELPLHTAVLRRRPDVDVVVHAHPRDVVVADLAGLPILPIVGAYDIPGAVLAAGGVPVFPRSALVSTADLGDAVADALGDRPVVVMRGHGLTATGCSVAEAVLRAQAVATLARLSLDVVTAGGELAPISVDDLAALPDLGGALNLETAWRHELARLT
ncbi:class II aldolase/adducin family protein [Nocardioides sp. MAH-18]|uniref:Class II aldolase/adducin family protein n=1 Tax=Nocardioides agri TaxID=2682843 RepID=A0A6L6XSR4_9ACTN|nr:MULTISPECIES: class II aldolase/adducin family protein [unclassified Nocardioides]MBA2953810.1 class II aldolase/adducin family protein [Nocardioides sp. CGMCC 1.13656]MVQ48675.1 class II aldolase/adducin family protein [Nocardioides sp. MAH-18]